MSEPKTSVAVIGSGNIGTDLMFKVLRLSKHLQMGAMVGIDPNSDGLARAARMGVPVTSDGVDGLIGLDNFGDIDIIFDATSAKAHQANAAKLAPYGKQLIDLTPAAIGPFVVPTVNLEEHLDAGDVNMVTCGGQATIPIVAAVARVAPVPYAEIVASIASKSAGPGTRANIDEFTETTCARDRGRRRRQPGQGDHRAQPGRPTADHARHRVLSHRSRRPRHPGPDCRLDREDGRRRRRLRPRLPPQAGCTDHPDPGRPAAAHPRRGAAGHGPNPPGVGVS